MLQPPIYQPHIGIPIFVSFDRIVKHMNKISKQFVHSKRTSNYLISQRTTVFDLHGFSLAGTIIYVGINATVEQKALAIPSLVSIFEGESGQSGSSHWV